MAIAGVCWHIQTRHCIAARARGPATRYAGALLPLLLLLLRCTVLPGVPDTRMAARTDTGGDNGGAANVREEEEEEEEEEVILFQARQGATRTSQE